MTEKLMLTYYAVSPIHAGSGSSLEAVDLPIQREKHTNYPHIQASAVKGALRAHFREFSSHNGLINLIFGTDSDNDRNFEKGSKDDNEPGKLSVSDAKLFAFPVRSNVSPFVMVTCPFILKRLNTDLEFCGMAENLLQIDNVEDDNAKSLIGQLNGEVILEDAVVNVNGSNESLGKEIQKLFSELTNLLLISDKMFEYIVSTATEVQTHIKIEADTGVTKEGSLRYQELLPSDTVLYSIVYLKEEKVKEEMLRKVLKEAIKDFIQIGGDQTLGKGICKVNWIEKQ